MVQHITKRCELPDCDKTETLEKTIENPNPKGEISTVPIKGVGEVLGKISLDLCVTHHAELRTLILAWATGQITLDSFINDMKAKSG